MTTFWSLYICVLTIGTLIGLTWLLVSTRKGETKSDTVETMGHSFDGIEEYDNPLPQWWFMLFVGTLVFSVGYLILYPGLGNWKGLLPGYENGWTGVHEWEKEMDKADAKFGPIYAKYASMPVEQVAQDPAALKMGGRIAAMPAWGEVLGEDGVKNVAAYVRHDLAGLPLPEGAAVDLAAGKQAFDTTCVACHGANGKGMPMMGAPDLTQPAGFIYGTSLAQLQQTIRHGRQGHMPAQNELLGNDKVQLLAAYVFSLSHGNQEEKTAE